MTFQIDLKFYAIFPLVGALAYTPGFKYLTILPKIYVTGAETVETNAVLSIFLSSVLKLCIIYTESAMHEAEKIAQSLIPSLSFTISCAICIGLAYFSSYVSTLFIHTFNIA